MDNIVDVAHATELKLCAESFIYFCETYVKVIHYKKGLVPFILHDYQKRYVKFLEENRFVIATKFRQGGFSTLHAIWSLWRCLFKSDQRMMIVSKTDRECIWLSDRVKRAIQELPEWIIPEMDKNNDHQKSFPETGSTIYFYTPEMARGRAASHWFFEEAAFIGNMDSHWKAMFPTISTGSHVAITSTVNGTGNWFYQTYREAEKGRNDFKVFRCHYTENPEYAETDWAIETKKNLGAKGWRQEVLCEFLEPDNRTLDDKFNDSLEFFEDISAAEDLVKSMQEAGKRKRLEERDALAQRHKDEKFKIDDNNATCGVTYDFSTPYIEPINIPTSEKEKPTVHQFRQFKSKMDQDHFIHLYISQSREVPEPKFDNATIRTPRDVMEMCESLAEIYPSWKPVADYWTEKVETMDQRQAELEEKVNKDITPDLLVLAGVISDEEANDMPWARHPADIVLKNVEESFEDLKLSFESGLLTVNSCPTKIKEEDLRDLFNGTASLIGYKEAVNTTSKVIKKKLSTLFVKTKVKNE